MKNQTLTAHLLIAASALVILTGGTCRADAPPQDVEVNPRALMVTFFPVTLLQAFVGVTGDQAAKISAIEAKLNADRSAAKDDDEKRKFRRQADSDIKDILLPAQMDTLSRCALKLQILTNTFGHDNLARVTFTEMEASKMQPILATAYAQYIQANRERAQELTAFETQTEHTNGSFDQIQQEHEQKIKAMRAALKASVEPLLTDAQKAALIAH